MKPDLFQEDLRRKPEFLRSLADELRTGNPWRFLQPPPSRLVLVGMGSSAYAAGVAAARLRAHGVVAVAELASSDLLPDWGEETLLVPISASGKSRETMSATRKPQCGQGTNIAAV